MKNLYKTLWITTCLLVICIPLIAQPTLMGLTGSGGESYGTVFGLPTGGTAITQQFNLNSNVTIPGQGPLYSQLTQANNGKLYGMTYDGGTNNQGVLFEYDPSTNAYIKKLDFDFSSGYNPVGSLLKASNGKLYGMTFTGGSNSKGVIFEYDPSTNIYTKKIDFDGSSKGSNPYGSLMQAANGKLYGMTFYGGVNDKGVLFEYDFVTNNYVKKLDFDGTLKGSSPPGSLIQANNGKLYGMTIYGGANNKGVLFEYDLSANTYTKHLDFDGTSNGREPNGSLMQANNGKLYGMVTRGGANDQGVLFEYDANTNSYTKKIDFTYSTKGAFPYGSLIQASSGQLYGMAALGGVGAGQGGVLFEYDATSNTFTKKLDFDGTAKGMRPQGTLMQANNGQLYGMTNTGGVNNAGVLFEYAPSTSTFTKKIDFQGSPNGLNPQGSLIRASNGKLYGMTQYGGVYNAGILFEYDATSLSYTKKIDFSSFNTGNGANPYGSLIQASNGKLYGMTYNGGLNFRGVLFEYDPLTNILTKKLDFDGTTKGSYPYGSLMQANNGKLYGMTYQGGSNNKGVLFEYDFTTGTYTKKIDFDGTAKGNYPYGSLTQASNGKLYGMTYNGGVNNKGVLFEYDFYTDTYVKKVDFDGTTKGSFPGGSLTQANNGKLYGMTQGGGGGNGVMFEYDPFTDTYLKKFDFAYTTKGGYPYGSLMQASNSNLYGMTQSGGVNGFGTLFEYDISTNTFVKKLDYTSTQGRPGLGHLIEIDLCGYAIAINRGSSQVCPGASVSLTATGGVSYSWATSGGAFASTTGSPTAWSATASGTYTVTVSALNNTCTNTATTTIQVKPLPTGNLSSNSPVLLGSSVNLSATGGVAYQWACPGGNCANGFVSTSANPSFVASMEYVGTYTVTLTGANSCSNTATIGVVIQALPITPPTCAGGTLVLKSPTAPFGAHAWAGPNGYKSGMAQPTIKNISPAQSGVYTVSVTYNNNIIVGTVSVSVSAPLSIVASSNAPLCNGGTLKLVSPTSGSKYAWKGPKSFNSSIQNPMLTSVTTANSGIYSLTVTGTSGCYSTGTTSVKVNNCTATRLATAEENATTMTIDVSPNPTSGQLKISIILDKPSPAVLKLSNIMGNQLKDWQLSESLQTHQVTVDISEVPLGIYLLQAETQQKQKVTKIIKVQ